MSIARSILQSLQPLLSDRSPTISLAPPAPLSFLSEGVRSINLRFPTLALSFRAVFCEESAVELA